MPDPYVIESDAISAIAMSTSKKYRKATLKVDWLPRPLLAIAESIKGQQGISGQDGEIIETVQSVPGLIGQTWRGTDAIMAAQQVRGNLQFSTGYVRHVMPIKFDHDEWLQRGIKIVPHTGGDVAGKIKKMGEAQCDRISSMLWDHTLKGVNKAFDDAQDMLLHSQGSTSKDPLGLNGMLPIATTGSVYGHNRALVSQVQHLVRASAVGGSGTLIDDLEFDLRELNKRNANSNVGSDYIWLAGGEWLSAYKAEHRRVGKIDLNPAGQTKLDGVILDDALRIGTEPVIYDNTLDDMDVFKSSERGIAISPNLVTFSGGGSPTRQASGYAVTNGSGGLVAIIVTDPGAGYTSAPTCAVATGTGATITTQIYSTNSGASFVTVAADDVRIGRVATVTVSVAGTGFTVGDQPKFARRAYRIPRKALTYLIGSGTEREVTHPADARGVRSSELQLETIFYWYNRFLRGCYLNYVK